MALVQHFSPSRIYVDRAVQELPLTRRVLTRFQDVPVELVDDPDALKKPMPFTEAKKKLLITRSEGQKLKSCQGMGDYVCCNYLTISLISNCHFECSYCILQDYLKNNPVLTLFANVDEILETVGAHISRAPDRIFRVGTGELSDSLALDSITGFSMDLAAFAKAHPNVLIELKTKSDQVDHLLNVDAAKRLIVSWSINPQSFIDQEEFKCASLGARLSAARKAADAGHPVAFHFDPLLALDGWENEYPLLVAEVAKRFKPEEIAWISMGSLRYTPGLKSAMKARFPKSRLLYGELFPSEDGKIRYFREVREMLYNTVKALLDSALPAVPNYLCMETPKVWEKVYQGVPSTQNELESRLTERFAL